jgi:hypothetical protein
MQMRPRRPRSLPGIILPALLGSLLSACGGGGGGSGDGDDGSGNTAPDARLQTAPEALTGEAVALDASASSDPDGDGLAYEWRVADAPDASSASLGEASGKRTTFTPDAPGDYTIALTVTDGRGGRATVRRALPALSRLAAHLPQADLGPDRLVPVNQPVEMNLDIPVPSGENGPDLSGVSATWRLAAQPGASDAAITGDRFTGRFTPRTAGRYEVAVTLEWQGRSWTFSRNVAAGSERAGGLARLPGSGGTPIADATFGFILPRTLDPAEVSEGSDGTRFLRTEVDVELGPEATVAQLNAVLDDVGGGIVAMNARAESVLVRVPDPGDLAALDSLLTRIENRSGVSEVGRSVLIEPPDVMSKHLGGGTGTAALTQSVPGNITPGSPTDRGRTDHQLAVRAHGAWNMRGAIPGAFNDRPWLLIADFFGDGEPDGDYNAITRASDYRNFAPGGDNDDCGNNESCMHGYHVLGIILGNYGTGPGGTVRDDVTGVFPANLRVRAIDLSNNNNTARTRRQLVRNARDLVQANGNDTRIVINTSLGLEDPPVRRVNRHARKYARGLRRHNLVDNVLHATTAGNTSTDNSGNTLRWPARRNSPYTWATLGDIQGPFRNPDELDNILVVENRTDSAGSPSSRPTPQCLSGGSLFSGNFSGIGDTVWSFGRDTRTAPDNTAAASDSRSASNASGTSMSAPQVAGVAAYAWAVGTNRSGPDLVRRMLGLGRSDYVSTCGNAPQPVVDAFDVVRSSGDGNAEPRRSLHDVAGSGPSRGSNGAFDANDVEYTLAQFGGSAAFDYGRLDFNGDGWTDGAQGSSRTAPVELNGDDTRATIQQSLEGYDRAFDETAVTDFEVLCFDAYGSPYNGDTKPRNRMLGEPCGIVDVEITHPSAGSRFVEGEAIAVEADITINGQHDGTVSLRTGGNEVDDTSWQYNSDNPATLETRRVCPGSASRITVRFNDPQTGLRADATLDVGIAAPSLEAVIGGQAPRYVRVTPGTGASGPKIGPTSFQGQGELPSCTDPDSSRLSQAPLTWLDDGYQPLSSGVANIQSPPTDMTLFEDYLADGSGGFESRRLALEYDDGSRSDTDTVWVKPCSSDLGFGDAVAGYPECPNNAVGGDVVEDLRQTFDTAAADDIAEILGQIINGEPAHRGVLDELGREPCDPRFCDPRPPTFPGDQSALLDELRGTGFGSTTVGLVEDLFGAVEGASTVSAARESLQAVMSDARSRTASGELGSDGRALVQAAYTTALASLEFFAPGSEQGQDGWAAFLGEEERAALPEGAALEPARGGLQGFLTMVTRGGVRGDFGEHEIASDAAGYGAAIAATEVVQSSL